MANQYTTGKAETATMHVINLQRELLQRHKEAGKLAPAQHVFTIDDLSEFTRKYAIIMARYIARSKAHNKLDQMTEINRKVLKQAIAEYKKLNKTA